MERKMGKKRGAIILLLLCFILASCGQKSSIISLIHSDSAMNYGDTGGLELPLDTNHTKISILVASDFSNLSDKLVIKELSERTGLDVDIIEVPPASIQEKAKVMLSSNDMPDIVNSSFSFDEINQLGAQGTFVSINKYINELPNLKKHFVDDDENNIIFNTYTSGDNNLYVFPKFEFQRPVNHGFLYRKDIFDRNGISAWKSTEEFYQALKKLKTVYPSSFPYVSKTGTQIFSDWSTSWGIHFPGLFFDEEEQIFKYSATDPKAKQMLDFMRKLYVEGLLDEEFLTCTQGNWEVKMTEPDKAFVTFDWISQMDIFYEQVQESNPEFDLRYAYPVGPTGNVATLSKIGGGPAVTNNSKKLLSLKLLDYLLSPSGAELMTLGVQNKTFQVEKDGSVKYLGFSQEKTISIDDLEERYGMFIDGLYRRVDKRSVYFNYSKKEQEAQDMIIKENRFAKELPPVRFESAQKAQVSKWTNDLYAASMEFAQNYVLGNDAGETSWDRWAEKANYLGAEELVALYNHQYQKYLK